MVTREGKGEEKGRVVEVLMKVIGKYDNGKTAFNKADNTRTFVHLTFRTDEDKEEFEKLAIDVNDLINGIEPKVIEMSYESFVFKYKPKLIWYDRKSGQWTYSALMGGYKFARGYKVVIMRIRFLSMYVISVATELSKNVYPISFSDSELIPSGLIVFIPN